MINKKKRFQLENIKDNATRLNNKQHKFKNGMTSQKILPTYAYIIP